MLPNDYPQKHQEAIDKAKLGDEMEIQFLRLRLRSTAKGMPVELLIRLSQMIVDYRRGELRDEANRN